MLTCTIDEIESKLDGNFELIENDDESVRALTLFIKNSRFYIPEGDDVKTALIRMNKILDLIVAEELL